MRALAILLLLCGVAVAEVRKVPPPARLVARPIEVGQWAAYHERIGGRDAGNVLLVAVNRAECGMQFLAVLHNDDAERRWIFCVDDQQRIVKATLDGKLVVLHEHVAELGALLTRVLPPAFSGTFTREDLLVPAAYFEGAERKDGNTTTWLHPDVPLGAVVRVKDGAREDELTGYGEGGSPAETSPSAPHHRRHPRVYIEPGIGTGIRSATPGSDHVDGFSDSTGIEETRSLDLVGWVVARDNRSSVASDTEQTAMVTALLGVRWHVFGRGYRDTLLGMPYVELGAGYAHIGVDEMPSGNGVAAGLRLGWEILNAGSWAFALQGEYLVDHTWGDVGGSHQLLDATVAIRLQLP